MKETWYFLIILFLSSPYVLLCLKQWLPLPIGRHLEWVVPPLLASPLPVSLCLLFFHSLWRVTRAVGWQMHCWCSRETWAVYLTRIHLLLQWDQSYYIPKSEGKMFRKYLRNNFISFPSYIPFLVISLLKYSLLLRREWRVQWTFALIAFNFGFLGVLQKLKPTSSNFVSSSVMPSAQSILRLTMLYGIYLFVSASPTRLCPQDAQNQHSSRDIMGIHKVFVKLSCWTSLSCRRLVLPQPGVISLFSGLE